MPEEGVWSLGTRVTDGYDLPCGYWELNLSRAIGKSSQGSYHWTYCLASTDILNFCETKDYNFPMASGSAL